MGAAYIDTLERFDRKERGWLIRECVGGRGALSGPFRSALASAFSTPAPDSAAWWTIDYHLDWLAGVANWSGNASEEVHSGGGVTGSIEDVDLIIAISDHLFLIEAKAAGSWSNGQLQSKLARLDRICPAGKLRVRSTGDEVKVHFGILSIRPAVRVDTSQWPEWALNGAAPFVVRPEAPGSWSKLAVQRVGPASETEIQWRIIETATQGPRSFGGWEETLAPDPGIDAHPCNSHLELWAIVQLAHSCDRRIQFHLPSGQKSGRSCEQK
ncbi:MAG: hypothetical protein DI570_19590 [Phenylobacterium zucineum]|nr:MAG: hypothetical protein DI570_19590 [Phenylobacterium zucineum]